MLTARPTTYKGIQMRSRLEATFAAFLDRAGFYWLYEPRAFAGDGGQYLPDFEIPWDDDRSTYVEVKPPLEDLDEQIRRMGVILESQPESGLLLATPAGTWSLDMDWAVPVRWCLCPACGQASFASLGLLRGTRAWCRHGCESQVSAFVDPFSSQFRS